MPIISWSDGLSVNVTVIDEQHKKLIDIVNRLFDAMKAGKAKGVVGQTIDELREYTVYHFATEEKYFADLNYPDSKVHNAEHLLFVEKLDDLKMDMAQGKLGIGLELMNFLSNWLTNHIRITDQNYSAFFNENGVN